MKMISLIIFRKKLKLLMNSLRNNLQLFLILANFLLFLLEKTGKYLSIVTFYENLIKKAIRNLDPNKAHGHDMLSIRMLKICHDSLYEPLELIFQSCFQNSKFPSEWKKANVFPTDKKNDKQLVSSNLVTSNLR